MNHKNRNIQGLSMGLMLLAGAMGPQALAEDKPAAITPAKLNESWAVEWWEPRHEEKLEEARQRDIDVVMIGDSITHGWEDAGAEVWDEYYAERNALNLGFSGDRTENVLWRLQHGAVEGLEPELVVLMIGTNNTGHREEKPEHTALGVETIIEELQERLPEAPILLLGIFPRGESADDPLRELNRQANKKLETLADGEEVVYLNINEQFLEEDGDLRTRLMPDLLHPNARGYRVWAEAMEPTLKEMLGR